MYSCSSIMKWDYRRMKLTNEKLRGNKTSLLDHYYTSWKGVCWEFYHRWFFRPPGSGFLFVNPSSLKNTTPQKLLKLLKPVVIECVSHTRPAYVIEGFIWEISFCNNDKRGNKIRCKNLYQNSTVATEYRLKIFLEVEYYGFEFILRPVILMFSIVMMSEQ
ncbi:unnamed protein product [Brassica rapa subsp. trilocularis]